MSKYTHAISAMSLTCLWGNTYVILTMKILCMYMNTLV